MRARVEKEVFYTLHQLCGLSAAMEILFTAAGVKKAARISINQNAVETVEDVVVKKLGLACCLSPFKIFSKSDLGKGDFANLGARMPIYNNLPGNRFLYLSAHHDDATMLREADREMKGNNQLIGKLLGYPECCCLFFSQHWSKALATSGGDLTLFSLNNTHEAGPYDFYTNNIARIFDYKLISHFPCSYTCQRTIQRGQAYHQVLGDFDYILTQQIRRMLTCPILYSDFNGVFLFEEVEFLSETMFRYEPSKVKSSAKTSPLLELLTRNHTLQYGGKNHILFQHEKAQKKKIKHPQINLFLFCDGVGKFT
ncbi:DUF483 domain-containing protein [Candidatus Poribacteria bacterium]|nr:DUF483 domain-containing protein [Candidatus Poribacteria bacterium]